MYSNWFKFWIKYNQYKSTFKSTGIDPDLSELNDLNLGFNSYM